jgi:hypothetical protein
VGALSRFEGGVEDAFDRAAGAVFKGPIEPAQIAKRAAKQMLREKLVGAGKQHAPTLYNVLVNPNDDHKLFGFYPTMSAEIETYLMGKGGERGLLFDGRPLVRFFVDEKLKSGRFDVIAQLVAAPLIEKLRQEELERYGIASKRDRLANAGADDDAGGAGAFADTGAGRAQRGRDGFDVPADIPSVQRAQAARGGAGSLGNEGAGLGGAAVGPGGPPVSTPSSEALGLRAELHRSHRDSGRLRDDIAQPHSAAQKRERASDHRVGTSSGGPELALATGTARLVNMSAGKTYALTHTEMALGRDPSCAISIADANASRRHATLTQDVVGTWKITDLGSTNGILLNDRPITTALLREGDEITLGVTVLQFRES